MKDLLQHIASIQRLVYHFKKKPSNNAKKYNDSPTAMPFLHEMLKGMYHKKRQGNSVHSMQQQPYSDSFVNMCIGPYQRNRRKSKGQRLAHMARLLTKAQRYL